MSEIALKVENISKHYTIGVKRSNSLKELFAGISYGLANSKNKKEDKKDFWALKDISFEIKQGDAVGIIGKNGAGKSTLLKILSRITEPSTGKIELNGRVASLLEVGTGFHPELTGRENIYLNGAILGMSRAEIKSKFEQIVDFSGVEKFLETPVKRYSSGMYVRLAFAVAAHLEPEILIIDEVLAVGDTEFQKKCLGKMQDVNNSGRTIIFVSHNMEAVRKLCSKGILLKEGTLFHEPSDVNSIVDLYYHNILLENSTKSHKYENLNPEKGPLDIKEAVILNNKKEETNLILFGEPFNVKLKWKISEKLPALNYAVRFFDSKERFIFAANTLNIKFEFNEIGEKKLNLSIPNNILAPGRYLVTVGGYQHPHTTLVHMEHLLEFQILDLPYDPNFIFNNAGSPVVVLNYNWSN